jgi:hypothetical protein
VDPLTLVDLKRYPINDLSGAVAQAAIKHFQVQLMITGAAEIPGFVTPDGVATLVADAESLAVRAHPSGGLGSAYLSRASDEWPADHPRRAAMPYSVRAVGYDVIPTTSPLRQLYECDALTRFVEAVLNRGTLYHYADPCGALNLAVMGDGDQLQWHYDQTDFVVSLAIQAAITGGDFDVVPRNRSDAEESYDGVAKLFGGDENDVVTLAMTPGTLLIFEGRHSIHRVSRVQGARLRHVGLLAYDTRPDTTSTDELRLVRYGRREPFATPPATWPPS